MFNWFWKILERRFDALITHRIVVFHNAMIARRQIPPCDQSGPLSRQS